MLKVHKFLGGKISRYYRIVDSEVRYDDKKSATCYFVLKKKELLNAENTEVFAKNAKESIKK